MLEFDGLNCDTEGQSGMCQPILLTRDPSGSLRCSADGEPPIEVKPARLFPLTNPTQYIVLSDTEGNEVRTINDIGELDMESGEHLRAELDRTYFLPRIKHVLSLRESRGILQWSVQTDKGPREFEVRSRDDIRFLKHRRVQIIIKDIDGNRFEIWDAGRMDSRSRALLDRIL